MISQHRHGAWPRQEVDPGDEPVLVEGTSDSNQLVSVRDLLLYRRLAREQRVPEAVVVDFVVLIVEET